MAEASKIAGADSSCPSPFPSVFVPPEWKETADGIAFDSATSRPPITLVCGPGYSGKSTFCRVLLDSLLKRYKRVGYLDTDLGQPEFTPPGCLSLHVIDDEKTPDLSILWIREPERFYFYGDTTPKNDPKVYLSNIFKLYDHFIKEYHQSSELDKSVRTMLPLIINTSGWVKDTGYESLVKLLRYMSPSHVVQIRISTESKNLPTGIFWLDENQTEPVNLIEIHAACRVPVKRLALKKQEARSMRHLRVTAYFRQCLPRELSILSYKELLHRFASISPYTVPFAGIKVMHLNHQVPRSEQFKSLKAGIVGLAISSSVPSSSEDSMPWCVGLGIVRGLDISKELLYVITPIPHCSLKKVDLLLPSYIDIPACLSQVCDCLSPCTFTSTQQNLELQELDAQIAKTEELVSDLSI